MVLIAPRRVFLRSKAFLGNGWNYQMLMQLYHEDDGVLTFEWVLLLTLLVIGIVAGLTSARDAIIDELGDIAAATISFDQSFNVAAFEDDCDGGITAPGFSFEDTVPTFITCERADSPPSQGAVQNCSFPPAD